MFVIQFVRPYIEKPDRVIEYVVYISTVMGLIEPSINIEEAKTFPTKEAAQKYLDLADGYETVVFDIVKKK